MAEDNARHSFYGRNNSVGDAVIKRIKMWSGQRNKTAQVVHSQRTQRQTTRSAGKGDLGNGTEILAQPCRG
jgi:hypothetical protein